jgi:hypothetical protein
MRSIKPSTIAAAMTSATWSITATVARSLGSRGRRNACAFRRA